MKVLRIILLIVFISAVVLSLAVFIFIKSFDINRYKILITSGLGQAIDRQVTISSLALNMDAVKGVAIDISGLKVADSPHFSKRLFLDVDKIRFNFDVMTFLKNRKIVVTRVTVVSPVVNLIRDKAGKLNIPMPQDIGKGSLPVGNPKVVEPEPPVRSVAPPASQENNIYAQSAVLALDWVVDLFEVENGTVTWLDQFQSPALEIPVEKIDIVVSNFSLTQAFDINVGAAFLSPQKNIRLKGKGRLASGGQEFSFFDCETGVNLAFIDVSRLQAVSPYFNKEMRFTGELNGAAQLKFKGLDPQQVMQSLSGPVHMQIDGGKIENFNVLRVVLESISIIPNLVDKIYANLPEKYQKQMESDATVFEKIEADLQADNGALTIKNADIVADIFSLESSGSMDWAMNLSLTAALSIPQDLSQSMTKSVEELKYIVADDGRIMIPFQRYNGLAAAFRPVPDMEYMTKRILINRGGQEVNRLLDKVFGVDSPETQSEDQPAAGQNSTASESQGGPSEPQKFPGRKIIEGVLDSILQ